MFKELCIALAAISQQAKTMQKPIWELNAQLMQLMSKPMINTADINNLLKQGATLKVRDLLEQSVLTRAAEHGNVTAVQYLLTRGTFTQSDKDKALEFAVASDKLTKQFTQVVQKLIQAGANVNAASGRPLRDVIMHGNFELFHTFLQIPGIDLNARGAFNETPLFEAVKYGRAEMFEHLLAAGADFPQREKDRLLVWAARENHLYLTLRLIKLGADIHHGTYAGDIEGEGCRLARYYGY